MGLLLKLRGARTSARRQRQPQPLSERGGRVEREDGMKGYKFLTPYGSTKGRNADGATTDRHGQPPETFYPLPQPGEKWGPWFPHPNPAVPDGKDCGPGRWHIMKSIDARYAPNAWWVWYAEGRGVVGESSEKYGVTEIRLRRITLTVFCKMARLGWLRGADLGGADLGDANLRGADLVGADLGGAIGLEND